MLSLSLIVEDYRTLSCNSGNFMLRFVIWQWNYLRSKLISCTIINKDQINSTLMPFMHLDKSSRAVAFIYVVDLFSSCWSECERSSSIPLNSVSNNLCECSFNEHNEPSGNERVNEIDIKILSTTDELKTRQTFRLIEKKALRQNLIIWMEKISSHCEVEGDKSLQVFSRTTIGCQR